ncbi:MAG TPA: Hsp20/alpha crystallin family protein [Syntrophorhabdales bacterium]|nr:Hsp20/alpha crystallin family protein [Syntrophorhabdales bacterium]
MAAKKEVTPKVAPGTKLDVRREWEYPFGAFQWEMNKLFDDFFGGLQLSPWAPVEKRMSAVFTPHVDVSETDKEIKVSMELPGMDEKDVEVSLTRDTLTIKGEKKQETEDKGKDYYRMERSYGAFTRTIPLTVEVDTDKVQASFKKGVLDITLPKTARAIKETKKIPVKAK